MALNNYQKIQVKGKFPTKYKPASSKAWDKEIEFQLLNYSQEFIEFFRNYDEKRHYISAEYRFYFPFITKQFTIAKRAGDIDNMIKPVQDIIFNKLKIDDSQIISTSAIKINSEKPGIIAIYSVRNLTSIL